MEKINILDNMPTATVTPIRVCVFQATRYPVQSARTITTPFGSLTIDGRLGQSHEDFLDCAMRCADKHKIDSVGRLQLLIDPHKLRMALGGGKKYSAEQINVLRRDLMQAILHIETPTLKIAGHIVDDIREAKEVAAEDKRRWAGSGTRQLMVVIFSESWTKLINSDVRRYYDPIPLCRIEHGSVAAIARHVLTHQHQPNGGWKLKGLITAAGVQRQASKVKAEMLGNTDALAEMGIRIEDDRVFLAATAPSLAATAPS